jgi:hypothetical protein
MGGKLATIVVGLFLLSMAAIPGGAEASSADRGHSDLSSLPAIEAYLNSIGVDPGAAVVQQGPLNYAGLDCPGAGWNCTTANVVVQISTSPGAAANIVDCLPALSVTLLGLNECVIVQSSVSSLLESQNDASCDMTASDGAKQKCKIKQSSKKGNNKAEIRTRSTQRGAEGSQAATQDAQIEQTSDTGNNTAKITQTIEQSLSIGTHHDPTQDQQARQTASVTQTASSSGSNSSWVVQSMSQDENASSDADITQKQNAASTDPNQEATINQQSGTGDNNSTSSQTLNQHQSATSDPGPITQTQGTEFVSGQKKTVNQTTTAPGVNRSNPTESEAQQQETHTTTTPIQAQFGPQDCCSTQTGGTAANVNHIVQSNVQHNDTGVASQSSIQRGQCIEIGAPGAECSVDQTYTSNSGTSTFSGSGTAVFSNRQCSDTGEGAFCTSGD